MPDHESPSLDSRALAEIVAGTTTHTGEAFFDELVKHLARALGTKCAWITEWLEDERRLRALSFWIGDGYFGDYEYDVANTPCEPVITERRFFHVPDRVIELFTHDPDLEPLGAVSYMGIPLLDVDDQILGHLAILHDEPLPEDPRATAIFNIFAGRAAAELRRLRRDRDLREREQRLARLIDSAMDAIIELDTDLSISRLNSAGEGVFACPATEVMGTSFDRFLTPAGQGKLKYLIGQLAQRADEKPSLWIPDGIEAMRADGESFLAEATLSRFELGGRAFYTLILRDVNDRLEAEERIRKLLSEAAYLRAEIDALHGFEEIVGQSKALRRVLADVEQVSGGDTTVLITGETGTGKELIARAVHRHSPRAEGPLVTVNCAAVPASLQESEFFGHEKGAFTGATQRRVGRFQLADGGTIFLDEVGELPLDLQAKLLRVLQEGEFESVGGSGTIRVDVRVIAATNRDLGRMVQDGAFREDLLYRLNVFPLRVPPLRDRGHDVVLLAEAFATRLARRAGLDVVRLSESDRIRLVRYDWPGNVRELHNVIERALITSPDGRTLDLARALPEATGVSEAPSDAPGDTPSQTADRVLTDEEMRGLERANIRRALETAKGRISGRGGAAELLGINPNTLSSRMKSLGITRTGG